MMTVTQPTAHGVAIRLSGKGHTPSDALLTEGEAYADQGQDRSAVFVERPHLATSRWRDEVVQCPTHPLSASYCLRWCAATTAS